MVFEPGPLKGSDLRATADAANVGKNLTTATGEVHVGDGGQVYDYIRRNANPDGAIRCWYVDTEPVDIYQLVEIAVGVEGIQSGGRGPPLVRVRRPTIAGSNLLGIAHMGMVENQRGWIQVSGVFRCEYTNYASPPVKSFQLGTRGGSLGTTPHIYWMPRGPLRLIVRVSANYKSTVIDGAPRDIHLGWFDLLGYRADAQSVQVGTPLAVGGDYYDYEVLWFDDDDFRVTQYTLDGVLISRETGSGSAI